MSAAEFPRNAGALVTSMDAGAAQAHADERRLALTASDDEPVTSDQARALTDQIKAKVEHIWALICRAYTSRAWEALGYSTWDDYCTQEFGTTRLRLPREERQEVVSSLREAGLSTRAIASAIGINRETVRQEVAAAGDKKLPPEPESSEPGRDRPEAAGRDDDGGDVAPPDPSPAPNPAPPRVTGTDGKSYASTTRRNREVMDEAAELMGEQADAKAERLRANYARLHHQFVSGLLALSPEHVAAVLDEPGWEDVERTRQQTEQWFRELMAARPKPFSVIQGGA